MFTLRSTNQSLAALLHEFYALDPDEQRAVVALLHGREVSICSLKMSRFLRSLMSEDPAARSAIT